MVAQYLQAVADANSFSVDRVQVLEKRQSLHSMLDTQHKKVELLPSLDCTTLRGFSLLYG